MKDMTAMEVAGSVTGFDELAITKFFGVSLADLTVMMGIRALAFVAERRDGLKDAEAYDKVMNLSVNDLRDYFAPEPEETMPDEPDSEVGKGN